MLASWRSLLIAVSALALLPAGAAAQALEQPALAELEGLLRDLGFDPGPVDGVVDDDTTAAIRRYKDFAVLPGEPEPDRRLLEELRGVAAAFAALTAGKAEAATAAAAPPQEEGAPPQEESAPPPVPEPAPEAMPIPAPEPKALPAPTLEKVIVPPPPAPPKLLAPESTTPETTADGTAEEPAQTAALPPPAAVPEPTLPGEPDAAGPIGEAGDPAADLQARIDAELLRFLHRLQDGSLTREDLARQFNAEGRQLLQQAQYDEAILKFSVAIHLDPKFAGAYSNRGTAYQRQEQAALAKADFDKAKELGFGGFRVKDASNPLQ
jgi:peptidoglycan hydrolase-like protein with peptidoglycan-binding domain